MSSLNWLELGFKKSIVSIYGKYIHIINKNKLISHNKNRSPSASKMCSTQMVNTQYFLNYDVLKYWSLVSTLYAF